MKRTILSLLVVGLFAGVGTSAIAQNVTAGDQPNANAQEKGTPEAGAAKGTPGMNAVETAVPEVNSATEKPGMSADEADPAASDAANAAVWKAQYTAAQNKAQSVYKDAKTKCDTLEGKANGTCMNNATAARTESLAHAKMEWDSHLKMDGRPAQPTKGDLRKPETEAANTQ
jgi:hypothetical protein